MVAIILFFLCSKIIFFKLKSDIVSPYMQANVPSINFSAVFNCPAVERGFFDIAYSILTPNFFHLENTL